MESATCSGPARHQDKVKLPLRVLTLLAPAAGRGARRGVGGHEVISLGCLDVWDRRQVVPLVAYSHEGQLAEVLRGSDLWRDYAFSGRRPLRQFRELCALLRRDSVDLIHCYGPVALDFIAVLAARAVGIKSVVTRPVMISDLKGPRILKCFLRRLDRHTLSRADRVVAICNQGRDRLLADGCRGERLATIYNGLDLRRFHPAVEPRQDVIQWRGGSLTIGMFAQMTSVKRHDVLLRSLAIARRQGRDWRLLLAGDGPRRADHESLARQLGVEDRVLFVGLVRDTPTLYTACDLVALPSDREGFPTTLLEAFACRRAVAATRTGGVAEQLEGVGLIVESNTAEAFYSALGKLEDRSTRQRLAEAGHKMVNDRFPIEVMVRGYEDLYLGCFPHLRAKTD